MDEALLRKTLESVKKTRIGVIGDFTLDAYWLLDTGTPENSVETGKPTQAVVEQKYSLGGAGNVVCNLVDLSVGQVLAFGVISGDIFGREMLRQLQGQHVDVSGMILQEKGWDTPVYAKPYYGVEELNRIDFGRFNVIEDATEQNLIRAVSEKLPELDALVVNQQLSKGIYSSNVVAALNTLATENPAKIFMLDSRSRSGEFENMLCKVNAAEAARICGESREFTELIPVDEIKEYSAKINAKTRKTVYVTRSRWGMIMYDGSKCVEIPGIQILKRIDPVGAGDTAVAAIAAVLAAGGDFETAGEIGNLAAAVTIQKLQQTGTASPGEIVDMWTNANYVFRPELADDIRRAIYVESSEIEIIAHDSFPAPIEHAIFDHDGTISVLRQGWENIMEPVMVHTILGESYYSVDEKIYHRVVQRVGEYIDQSTGIETIQQMQALVEMVREFGFVPAERILDAEGYKRNYDEALTKQVDRRLKKLKAGELDLSDLVIKGIIDFLEKLHSRGVRLYLASGTDHKDAVREAESLGYARFFEGRIYGYAGGTSTNKKRMVIQTIIGDSGLQGKSLACFGDGPVELREAKRLGGIAIGIASDEVRRYGVNSSKRARLIKAGADMVIPDYAQSEKVLSILFGDARAS